MDVTCATNPLVNPNSLPGTLLTVCQRRRAQHLVYLFALKIATTRFPSYSYSYSLRRMQTMNNVILVDRECCMHKFLSKVVLCSCYDCLKCLSISCDLINIMQHYVHVFVYLLLCLVVCTVDIASEPPPPIALESIPFSNSHSSGNTLHLATTKLQLELRHVEERPAPRALLHVPLQPLP